ncbi:MULTISPECIES: hypothetical protein [Streptomyces]|uniref:hypothetical protein n=1 Tax=Streptomyces TaxID=1883 RepID=UPI0022499314|nr:hypothetical protein [Streptomyces sp. JHD 1]MCX2969437.1 hypothetical protein [Streptomyces sp. JHD 1]
MTTAIHTRDVQHACTVLSSPALIRLITEIDDNGAIPRRGLARMLSDLTPHHIGQATELARSLRLISARPGAGVDLTTSGLELADVYDATARWARRHAYPAPVADFTSRIQHTLALLAQTPELGEEGGHHRPVPNGSPSAQPATDLAGPRDLLIQWLHANPQAAQRTECAE